MAPPKRLRITPLDDPPTASSSSDDDQPPSSKKPEDEVVDEEEDSEKAGEETEEDEDEGSSSEEEQVQPPSKNPPPSTPISNPKPDSGSESESGSESDSEQEPTPPNAKVKPLASKPMKAQPQAQTQSTPVPARSGTKRANENGSKPAKKKTTGAGGGSENEADGDGDVKMTGEDSKKMNQRVFTEGDEIAILKGLADFISKTGKDPMKELVEFHSFVKKSIHGDVTTEQLKRKVRGLKMKFKDGGGFTKEHDKKAFELSKKVWGNTEGNNNVGNEGEENGKVNEKTPKSTKKEAPVRNNGSAKKEKVVNGAGKDEGGVDRSLALSEMCRFGEAAPLNAMERGIGLLEESMVDEFNEGWRKVQIAEMELLVTRRQLLTDQARIALDALKKTR
ncbi:probable transcription factor At1g61730 [Vicia villosa]|uniref:probable transcription factor At1g61730 n=1 Tax=Vicia villosa TaxID=3911 RepID=UPI00273A9C8E|nr:probable transcription factor At1g61730 [Vicia villosa]